MYRDGMRAWRRLVRRVFHRLVQGAPRDPASAYDMWSSTYDADGQNILVRLDESLFPRLLGGVQIRGKSVVDVGCGTGRHWSKLLAQEPAELIGYDVSPGMLEQLRRKIPGA